MNLNNRFHDEFIEFGKSGKVYNKTSIIHYLNNLDANKDIEISSFKIQEVSKDLVIATYISYEKEFGEKFLRTSIWKNNELGWKLYFHQGTDTQLDSINY